MELMPWLQQENEKEKAFLGEWEKDERGNYFKINEKGGKITLSPEEWEEHQKFLDLQRAQQEKEGEKARKDLADFLAKKLNLKERNN